MQHTVHTPDGRMLAVEDRGDPAGWPVLVQHGTPSSRHTAFKDPWVRDAASARCGSLATTGRASGSPRPSQAAPLPTRLTPARPSAAAVFASSAVGPSRPIWQVSVAR